jgi:hypothetical protein
MDRLSSFNQQLNKVLPKINLKRQLSSRFMHMAMKKLWFPLPAKLHPLLPLR